jgi:hypothetical protein
MGWDLVVDYKRNEELRQYATKEFPLSHQIWHQWRDGYYTDVNDNEQPIPKTWKLSFLLISDPNFAHMFANEFDSLNPEGDYNVKEFVRWLNYWADHGANFELDM